MKALSINDWAAVLFDFDGVLVNSMPVHVEAWNRATLEIYGTELSAETKKTIVGQSTRAIAAHIASSLGPEKQNELVHTKHTYLNEVLDYVEPFPGAREFMGLLREHNISYGIASNAPSTFVKGVVERVGFEVDVILGRDDVDRPKPAPDLYLLCAKKLAISVSQHDQVVVFEDSLHGLKAASQAKMIPIGISSHHGNEDLRSAGAVCVFSDFNDVMSSIV